MTETALKTAENKEGIEITPKMIEAGVNLVRWWESDECGEPDYSVLARAIYTRMEECRQQEQS